eukprot:378060_1
MSYLYQWMYLVIYLLQYINDAMKPSFNNNTNVQHKYCAGEQMAPTLHSRFILMGHHQTDDSLQMTYDLLSLWKQDYLYWMGIAFGSVQNRDETYKYNNHDLNQLIFEFNDSETIQCINTTITTSDGNKILIECGGLSDGDNDPEGSILLVENNADNTLWKLYSTDFIHYDCYGDDTLNTMHFPRLDKMFSLNVEREFIRIDNINKYAYIASQYNNGIAILDIENLETNDIFSLGVHDLGFTGLDASEKDNNIGNDNDRDNPSFDTRSDDKGPKPESIIIGECSNGDTSVFIGLER